MSAGASLIEERLERICAQGRVPSAVAGVFEAGRLVDTASVSVSGVPRPSVDTQFRIGSITKTMTAVCIARAVEAGATEWEARLDSVLPGSAFGEVTLAQLASHRGGLTAEPVGPWWERTTTPESADRLRRTEHRVGPVAVAFHYSNLGFGLLGQVIERIEGRTWWQVVEQDLLGPLGMRRTTYAPTAPHAQGLSVVHLTGELVNEPHADTAEMAPAGQLWSTCEDLAVWADFLATGQKGVLDRAALDHIAKPRTVPGEPESYGLGLRLVSVGEQTMRGHTGSMPGFLASLFVSAESGKGCVLLANTTTGIDCGAVPADLLGPHRDEGPVEAWEPSESVPELARELAGWWFWGNTAFEARWENGRLRLRRCPGEKVDQEFVLTPKGFVGAGGYHHGEQLIITRDDAGTVRYWSSATHLYTRMPYDPAAPIPGGPPEDR